MNPIKIDDQCLTLTLAGRVLVLHSPGQPFITAVRKEKTYAASYGTVKETVTEKERIPLTELQQEDDGAASATLVFSASGHVVTLSVSWPEEGMLRLDMAGEEGWGYEFALPASAGEGIFGGGEQYRKVNLAGEKVVNFVSEHIKAKTLVEKTLLPRALYREKEHKDIGSYAPMPIFVTDSGLMILFETPADGMSDLTDDPYRFSFDACPKRLILSQAGSFREQARRLARLHPVREYLPDWCLDGMIIGVQDGTARVLEKAFALQDAGAKVSAVWCQDWCGENRTVMGKQVWWNWEVSEELYPGLKEAIGQLNERGIRFLAYINPYLVKDGRLYNECKEKGYLIRRQDGSIYHIKSTTFDAGMLDLTDPAVVKYVKETLIRDNMLALGISGWMADFGEYLPTDCVLHEGDPKTLHNIWPLLWAKVNREAIEEFGKGDEMFFSRSGYLGVQEYAPILWNGDQHTDWTKDYGMPCVMPASFSLGFSGVPLVHSDIGGFFSFMKLKRDKELFIRWMEMDAFSPLMRSHEAIRPWANAQPYDEEIVPYTVRLTNVHTVLKPYLQQLLEEAKEGIPAMRPDFWEAGKYAESKDPYAYFLGDDLFVCPVIEQGAKTRRVHLPEGKWIGLWDGAEHYGPVSLTVQAPLGQTPVFCREDSRWAEVFEALKNIDSIPESRKKG